MAASLSEQARPLEADDVRLRRLVEATVTELANGVSARRHRVCVFNGVGCRKADAGQGGGAADRRAHGGSGVRD